MSLFAVMVVIVLSDITVDMPICTGVVLDMRVSTVMTDIMVLGILIITISVACFSMLLLDLYYHVLHYG